MIDGLLTAFGAYQDLIDYVHQQAIFSPTGTGQRKKPCTCPLRRAYTSVPLSGGNLIVAGGMHEWASSDIRCSCGSDE